MRAHVAIANAALRRAAGAAVRGMSAGETHETKHAATRTKQRRNRAVEGVHVPRKARARRRGMWTRQTTHSVRKKKWLTVVETSVGCEWTNGSRGSCELSALARIPVRSGGGRWRFWWFGLFEKSSPTWCKGERIGSRRNKTARIGWVSMHGADEEGAGHMNGTGTRWLAWIT